ncbi:uncharacterized protein N7473_008968 [Penicillium subrubescens]|uniref:uncharacterized protein n=1 Tax=Penicillium subrubescens TaxID=1316194 RepID=UPI0025452C0A|nr:uncharacterized protein N7473_008968 [Penicillium subrubescens]KAJ5886294.1 hypothetical protein N7473_008968 [Penicillium subrubescens]
MTVDVCRILSQFVARFLRYEKRLLFFVHQSGKEFLLREALKELNTLRFQNALLDPCSRYFDLIYLSSYLESGMRNKSRGLLANERDCEKPKQDTLLHRTQDARQSVSTLRGHSGQVTLISWSPDRSRLTSPSDDRTIRIWDLATGQSVSTLAG